MYCFTLRLLTRPSPSIFKDFSSWPKDLIKPEPKVGKEILTKDSTENEEIYRYSVVASVPKFDYHRSREQFSFNYRYLVISWSMRMVLHTGSTGIWDSQDHFSTLPTSTIPTSGMGFVNELIQPLREGWLEFCDEIDRYLSLCVRQHLRSRTVYITHLF
jgi:hypothetical protein